MGGIVGKMYDEGYGKKRKIKDLDWIYVNIHGYGNKRPWNFSRLEKITEHVVTGAILAAGLLASVAIAYGSS